jgi:glucose-6-phosphate-specific signal transduction histidine kinase
VPASKCVLIRVFGIWDAYGLPLNEQDTFEVIIQDDGTGSDPSLPHAGLGFASIDARVHAVQGFWNITSHMGGPTALTVRLPLIPSESLNSVNRVDV